MRPWLGLKMLDLNPMNISQLKEKSSTFPDVRKGVLVPMVSLKVIGCSSLKGGGDELVINKNLDLWIQLVCTKLKLKHAI